MKNSILVILLSASFSWVSAQQIEISEAPRAMENGTYNSFLFELPDVNKKDAVNHWEKFMKDFKTKTKYNKKKKMYFSDDVKMPRLSNGTVDVYARILEDKNPNKRTSVIVWFDLGDRYVSAELDSLKSAYAKEILTEYAMKTSKYQAESVVKAEERRFSDMEKQLKKLKKANKNHKETIEKAKDTIAKNEKNSEINELDQKNLSEEMESQKEVIDSAKRSAKKFID